MTTTSTTTATTPWAAATATTAAPSTTLRLRSLRAERPADLTDAYRPLLPAFRSWYQRPDTHARPDLATAQAMLARHMPELVPTYRELCAALAPHDPLLQTMLTGWDPPSLLHNCSTVLLTKPRPVLARNYDYDPALVDGVVVESEWDGVPVLGTADQIWGLLDGVNGAGLAVSFTFGGRREEGRGFGIPLVLRYLLQTCTTVAEAVRALRSLPIHVAYNVSLLDRAGDHATVFVGPDRPAQVNRERVTTNHQERVHWPEHDATYRSTERQAVLRSVVRPDPLDLGHLAADRQDAVLATLLAPPVRADRYAEGFGTLYTAVYDVAAGTLTYHWPHDESWQLRLGRTRSEERTVQLETAATTRWSSWGDAFADIDWANVDWTAIDWTAIDWTRPESVRAEWTRTAGRPVDPVGAA